MTEEEAKTKTCHKSMVPVASAQGGVFFNTANCIGSACMAWRQDQIENPIYPKTGMATNMPRHITDTENGHCGLAGAP